MTLEITLDNLKESVKALRNLAKQIEQFPHDVAMESASNVGYSNVNVEQTDSANIVTASGNQIAFEEFGAGFVAEVADIGDFHTEPGIWSEDHAKTYQNWKGDMEDYPYNRQPKMEMQKEAERLRNETENKAKGYLS